MDKIKIFYVISSLCNEGPVIVLYNIISNIDFSKFEVTVVTLDKEKSNSRINDFNKLPIEIHMINRYGDMPFWKIIFEFRKLVNKIKPHLMHAHCIRSRMLMFFVSKEIKKIETLHNHPNLLRYKFGSVKGTILREMSLMASKKCDLLVACSDSIRKAYLERGLNSISIVNGSSYNPYIPTLKEKLDLKRKYNLDENLEWFVFVGRMSKEKRPEVAVEAFNRLRNESLGLIMVGDGEMLNEIKKDSSEKIVFVGYTEDVSQYLKCADYFISCSDTEGMPNALLESMAMGLPCAVSDIPAHHEVLDKSTKTIGLFFDNNNILSVIDAIKSLRVIRDIETVQYIQDLYVQYYTSKIMSEKYQSAYIRLVNDNKIQYYNNER